MVLELSRLLQGWADTRVLQDRVSGFQQGREARKGTAERSRGKGQGT